MISPLPVIIQTDLISFPVATALGAYGASPQMLRNTDSIGILIDKIIISSPTIAEARGGGLASPEAAAQMISVRLRWRNEPLTNGFVPVSTITFPRNRYWEFNNLGAGGNGASVIHLSKPMYLGPGDFIAIDFQWTLTSPALIADPVDIRAYAIGKQSPAPAVRWIPYLTAFVPPPVDGTVAASDEVISTAQDLGNPFDRPLFVERMIGRVLASGDEGNDNALDVGLNPIWALFETVISDDTDNLWIPDPAPFSTVFDPIDRSWVIGTEIPAKGYLKAAISKDASIWNAAVYDTFQRPVIGMIGYRQIVAEG